MNIVSRYIFREVAQSWFGVTLVLLLILISNSFASYLGDAAAGILPAGAVLTLVGLATLNYLLVVIPVGLFFAIMLALGRLYRDSEMTAMRACGVSSLDLYRPVMLFSVMLALALAALSLQVRPWARTTIDKVQQQARQRATFTHFQGGRFKQLGGNGVFYASKVAPDGQLVGVFAESHTRGEARIVIADSGAETAAGRAPGRLLVLHDGTRYEGTPGEADFRITTFHGYGVRMLPAEPEYGASDVDARPTQALWSAGTSKARAELQWRLAVPLSALVLAFLAVPLARTQPRQGRYGKLFAAILVYIIYQNVLGVAKVWVTGGKIPIQIGLWWVPAVTAIAALIVLWRQGELKPKPRVAGP